MRRILLIAAALPLIAAAPATHANREALRALQQDELGVATVAWRLETRNLARCPDHAAQRGFLIHEIGQYAPGFRADAVAEFGLGSDPAVSAVIPGSSAAKAGLVEGDSILRVNGVALATSPQPKLASSDLIDVIAQSLDQALAKGPIQLETNRGPLALSGDPGCAVEVDLVPASKLNAWRDGQIVQLTTAILDSTDNDDELAFILAHEMAHAFLKHPGLAAQKKMTRAAIRDTETEADRLALTLMAEAGFEPMAAPRLWARLGKKLSSDKLHMRREDRVRFLTIIAAALPVRKFAQ
jgi:beta-barrel assembly-enhancing protease